MSLDITQVPQQLKDYYGLDNPNCKNLNTLANYAINVTSPTGHFALKIYNPAWRTAEEVQWEIDLTLHLIKNGAPVAVPVAGKNGNYVQIFVLGGQSFTVVLFQAPSTPTLRSWDVWPSRLAVLPLSAKLT